MSISCRIVLLGLVLTLAGVGCVRDELTGPPPPNRAPTVWMSIGPPEGSTVDYNVPFFWGGWDPDGDVAFFEYAISNNTTGVFNPADTTGPEKWRATTARDSVFSFTADVVRDSSVIASGKMDSYEFVRSHTFFIRSVDDMGRRSKPVYRSFTARNLSPMVEVQIPRIFGYNIALVPPVVTFRWSAVDFVGDRNHVQDPDSVRSILFNLQKVGGTFDAGVRYIRNHPKAPEWTRWIAYDAPGDSGRWFRAENPLPFGTYMFAVQAKDDAGAVTPVFDPDRNVKMIRVLERETGPVLILDNRFLGRVSTTISNPPVEVVNLPGGVDLEFAWQADASSYGGAVAGYRYGWDIADVNDDKEWDVDFTPFIGDVARSPKRKFMFGTHTFHVEVIDNSGLKSRLTIAINVVPFTMERDLLLVDDWNEGTSPGFAMSQGALPNDAEHDAFWDQVLSGVAGFIPDLDVYPQVGTISSVPIEVFARYKTIIWNARGSPNLNTDSVLDKMARWKSRTLNTLELFMEAGGRVLICGEHTMTLAIDKSRFPLERPWAQPGPRYPFVFRYELDGIQNRLDGPAIGDASFAYDACCLNVVEIAYGNAIGKYRKVCRVDGEREFNGRDEGLRACVPSDETYAMPRLELRPEVAGPGKWFRPEQLGLNANAFNAPYFAACPISEVEPLRSCFQPMYVYECVDHSSGIYGAPVAFWSSRYADVSGPARGRNAVWGFSPVYFNPGQVRAALEIILFDEWKLKRKTTAPLEE